MRDYITVVSGAPRSGTSLMMRMLAAGGISGAEGCIWLNIEGASEQIKTAEKLVQSLASEPPFIL